MQYLLEIEDHPEKDFLLTLLSKFDFVSVLPRSDGSETLDTNGVGPVVNVEEEDDFFADAGMLSHWTISAKELRNKAWGIQKR